MDNKGGTFEKLSTTYIILQILGEVRKYISKF